MNENNSFKLIHLKKSLGINKLGKTEKRVLVALLQYRKHPYDSHSKYPHGNDYYGLAGIVYGIVERAYGDLALTHSMYSTLSSVLHRLWEKGLVHMYKPHYRKKWMKKIHHPYEEDDIAYMSNKLIGLDLMEVGYRNKVIDLISERDLLKDIEPNHNSRRWMILDLPNRTHKWWMLTENGRKIAELLK